jgi:DNA polymerase III sliding clamp (beta) subunit (PCNA family)
VVNSVIGEPIDVLVHAEMLSSAIENTSAETVEITPDTNRIKIKVGSRNASVPTLPIADNWFDRQERRAVSRVQVTDHESFVPILKIAHGITKSSKLDEYKHVEITPETGFVRIACTNKHQTLWAKCDCTTKGSGTVAVPGEAIDEMLKAASSSMLFRTFENAIAYNSGSLSLESSVKAGSRIVTPMIPGIITQFRKQDSPSIILDRVELINAIKSADSVAQKRAIPSVKMEFGVGVVTVSCDNSETSVSSDLSAGTIGTAAFRFAASDIVNTLAKLPGEKIQVEYPPDSPTVFFLPFDNENILIALQIIRNE